MNVLKNAALAAALATVFATGAVANEGHGTADDAMHMLEKAEQHYNSVGREEALKHFSSMDTGWHDRDLYVFCLDESGKNTAHGANPALVGRDLSNLKDADGKHFVKDLISTGQNGGGWVDYRWPNPTTKKVEPKSSLVKKMGQDFCGVGIYK